MYHSKNGPAISRQTPLGTHKEWWIEGKRHRIDGAAIEYADGTKHWFYDGEEINCSSQEEFEKYVKNKAFW